MHFFFFRRRKQKNIPPPSNERKLYATMSAESAEQQRTYLSDTPYLLPKDVLEDQRLNFQHHVLYRTMSNHYLAPISSTITTILDVGTGTGIWPIEMAALFPQAHIVGVDVALTSLPHPLPAACLFAQANILTGLPFPDQLFDFTHQRLLVAAIPALHWPAVLRELVRVTRVGGWIELLEIGDTIQNAGPATTRLLKWMTEISKGLGFEMEILHHLGDLLRQAGCEMVEAQDIPVPLGEWAGTIGQKMKTDIVHGFYAIRDHYCPLSHTPPEVFEGMLQAALEEWETNHTSYVFHAVYGRRG